MDRVAFVETRDVIVSAFNSVEFDMFLFERLGFDRSVEIADGPFKVIVDHVLRQAQREG